MNVDFPESRLMIDATAELSSLDCVRVGHAREVLEQQLAEMRQHATAKEEELKKAKEEASITERAAALRGQEHLETMAELTGVSESYSRCRADLASATAKIKGLKEALDGVRGELDAAHRDAVATGKLSCQILPSCYLPSMIIAGNLRSSACWTSPILFQAPLLVLMSASVLYYVRHVPICHETLMGARRLLAAILI